MAGIPRRRTRWVACNAVGMLVYLYLASTLWLLPSEHGLPGGPGDAFYWLMILVPVLLTFLSGNLVVLAVIALRRRGRQRLVATAVSGVVALLWVGTVAVDQERSFRHIDAPHE